VSESDQRGARDGLPEEAIRHYAESGYEAQRLESGSGQLELVRTKEILDRLLPPPPAVIVDAGGGPGAYACWLASKGYEVHLIDAVPLHVELAKEASKRQPQAPLASAVVGDARKVDIPDETADIVLLFGPLYHLTERVDRIAALREARRVTREGGLVLSIGISRFASALDGLRKGFLQDPAFVRIVEQDLMDGQHRNPTAHPSYFTTSYFHHPDDLDKEITEAGLRHEGTLAVEGPGWLLQDFEDHWSDPVRRETLLSVLRRLEREPTTLGVSAHMLAVARRT
jgi:ubiquinone/menaquinone biosynthesis C-methylase UbiE